MCNSALVFAVSETNAQQCCQTSAKVSAYCNFLCLNILAVTTSNIQNSLNAEKRHSDCLYLRLVTISLNVA
jgi:hypothetical protein